MTVPGGLPAVLLALLLPRVVPLHLGGRQPRSRYQQTLRNFQNVQYVADFFVGGQRISGIFDTGSFEVVVRSTRCGSCVHPTAPYDRSMSRTYEKNGTVARHVFGSGPCVSMKGYDAMDIGPMRSSRQAFWEIMEHRIPALDHAEFAAIVGIGPHFGYSDEDNTLLMSLNVSEFAICLQKPSGSDGYLTWGPTVTQQYKDLNYAKATVLGKHHWGVRMQDVSSIQPVGAHLENVPCMGSGCAAIIDSGTSLIAAPGYALVQLSKQMPPINEDCSNLHELPTLHFKLDGNTFSLPPQAYVMRITGAVLEADSIWDILFFKPKMRKVNLCLPAFMQLDMMSQFGPVWILGMPFFRYYHTTFDRINKEMHFAVAGPDCSPQPYHGNGTDATNALLAMRGGPLQGPMDVDISAIVPPTLSGMLDVRSGGSIEL